MADMPARKRIGLVAHDQKKADIVAWAARHLKVLQGCEIWATGTTGGHIAEATGLPITRLKSGPLGGDQQLGAMIAEGRLDVLFFFVDPLASMPHDVDVKALLRISTLEQVVFACNEATADFVITSELFGTPYQLERAPHG
ncbi:MAG: methylglyoxal synthase [Rhodobacteraceae bacterium]|nr:methylglyoxal synthase [Paracoccaceae bacterium]